MYFRSIRSLYPKIKSKIGNNTHFENYVDFVDWLADSIIQCQQDRSMLESKPSGWQ